MALSIVNNSTAIGAQSSVNNANNNLTKTISISPLDADHNAAASPFKSFLVLNSVDDDTRSISCFNWSTSIIINWFKN